MSSEACRAARSGAREACTLASRLFEGAYRSRVKGPGLDYMDFREYQLGDDVRLVDWRVTARTPSPEGGYKLIVREHEAEGSVELLLLVDASKSMSYGAKPRLTGYVCSALLAVAERMGDLASVVVLRDTVKAWWGLRPREALEVVLRELCKGYEGREALRAAASALRAAAPRRVVAVLVTDYANPLQDYEELLRSAGTAPLLLILVADPSEVRPPPLDALTALESPEGGVFVASLAEAYREAADHVKRVYSAVRARCLALEVLGATSSLALKLARSYSTARLRRAAGWVV